MTAATPAAWAHDRRPAVIAGLLAAAWVLAHLRQPLIEDSLFWWVPQGLWVAEHGPALRPAGPLPSLLQTGTLPPQWADGLPDYAHPPLWFWYLGAGLRLLGPQVEVVHLLCLLPAVLAAVGFARLGQRLLTPWAGLAIFGLPPLLAQFLRPELDLPLLAVIPWALLALLDGQWPRFALLGALAPWCKEPGVLLVVPALVRCLDERRLHPAAFAPLLSLGAWALLHGDPAKPEHLPDGLLAWLIDLYWSARIVFVEQGRWLLLVGLALGGRRLLAPATRPALALALTWLLFFSVVGFFVTRTPGAASTHVRYFLPGMALGAVLLAGRHPYLAALGLLSLQARSPFGPEASLFGLDQARAEQQAAPWIAEQLDAGAAVWVGSYQGVGLTQPWAGVVDRPLSGLVIYGPDTDPAALPAGAWLLSTAYGEPLGLLGRDRPQTCRDPFTAGAAWVRACRIDPG